jgi:hypothetical protein
VVYLSSARAAPGKDCAQCSINGQVCLILNWKPCSVMETRISLSSENIVGHVLVGLRSSRSSPLVRTAQERLRHLMQNVALVFPLDTPCYVGQPLHLGVLQAEGPGGLDWRCAVTLRWPNGTEAVIAVHEPHGPHSGSGGSGTSSTSAIVPDVSGTCVHLT